MQGNVDAFWRDVYTATGTDESKLEPYNISVLLDTAQRALVQSLSKEEIPDLGDHVEIDVPIADEDCEVVGDILKVRLRGGKFWDSDGTVYDDSGSTIQRELLRVLAVSVKLDDQEQYQHSEETSFEDMSYRNTELGKKDFYLERANEGLKWCVFGDDLYLFPIEERSLGGFPHLRIWLQWYPERFIDSAGAFKTTFLNDSGQCELPAKYWPMLVDQAASKIYAAAGRADLVSLAQRGEMMDKQAAKEQDNDEA